jgi:hypothetical protein
MVRAKKCIVCEPEPASVDCARSTGCSDSGTATVDVGGDAGVASAPVAYPATTAAVTTPITVERPAVRRRRRRSRDDGMDEEEGVEEGDDDVTAHLTGLTLEEPNQSADRPAVG